MGCGGAACPVCSARPIPGEVVTCGTYKKDLGPVLHLSWVTGIGIVTVLPKAILKTSSSVCGTTGWWQNRQEARPSGCAFEQDTGTFYVLAATESTALFSHVLLSRYSALLNQKGELRAKTPATVRKTVRVTESGHRD